MPVDLQKRERACLELLEQLPAKDYVLIGGYAASSFDFPRFSVDLDLVIAGRNEKGFTTALEVQTFEPVPVPVEPARDIYGSRFKRFESQALRASVDLLINSVISRQTGAAYSFSYLFRNSELREVVSFSTSLKVRARVANREMLIALKANSMRRADMRDIIALCNSDVDANKVANHLKRCPRTVILKHIDDFLAALGDEQHKDSIKGVFRLSDSVYGRITGRARKALAEVKDKLAG